MAPEALKKLRKFSCAELCEGKAVAVGLRCEDFSCCEDCAAARTRAASALLDEVEKRLMPEGVEWPRFEDGEPVRIGDEIALKEKTATVDSVRIHGASTFSLWYDGGLASATYFDGAPAKRPEPEDTQERIDEDAGKGACVYFGWNGIPCREKGGCPAYGDTDCDVMKTLDLLRRQRAICEKEAGR